MLSLERISMKKDLALPNDLPEGFVMEKLPDEKCLAHATASINHYKLAAPRVAEALQFTDFSITTDNFHSVYC